MSRVFLFSGASLLQGLLTLVSLPIVTRVLGPADYGVYALVTSVVVVAVAIADLGQNVVLSGHYRELDRQEQKALLGTLLTSSLGAAVLLAVGVIAFWPILQRVLSEYGTLPGAVLWWAVVAIPARSLISTATQFFVIANKSNRSALIIAIQAVVTFGSTLVALLWFEAGMLSLFVGFGLGAIAAMLVGGWLLWPMIEWRWRELWAKRLLRVAPSTIATGLMESARTMIENVLLAHSAGVATVGLYTHAKLYYSLLMQGTNSVAYVLWPRALDEGRGQGDFVYIGHTWRVVYFWLVAVGFAAAAFGYEAIAILTHGKFATVAPWVPIFVAYLLLQNSGKAATAVLYAQKRGVWVSNTRLGMILMFLLLIWFIIPVYGVQGLLVLLFAEMLVFRVIMGALANRLQRIPFQDGWVIGGCLAIMVFDMAVLLLELSLVERILLFIFAASLLLWIGRNQFQESITQARMFVRGPSAALGDRDA